jgi:hypothetical protein
VLTAVAAITPITILSLVLAEVEALRELASAETFR